MLDRLASGGLFTVIPIALMALGYARVFDAPRKIYIVIAAIFALTIICSQFLPSTHIFRITVAENLLDLGKFLIWLLPVLGYGLLIRQVRKKTKAREEHDGT